MENREFWLRLWRGLAITVIPFVLIVAIGSNYSSDQERLDDQHTRNSIIKMVEAGASPLEAQCTMTAVSGYKVPVICQNALLRK